MPRFKVLEVDTAAELEVKLNGGVRIHSGLKEANITPCSISLEDTVVRA